MEQGLAFESINLLEYPEAMEELMAAGLRSVPAVRSGAKFAYAQSLDDVAGLLGSTNGQAKLSQRVLLDRWSEILERAKAIVHAFDEDTLRRRVIPKRERTIRDLSIHVFQVAESFMCQVKDDTIDARAIYLDPRADIRTRADVVSYIDAIHRQYHEMCLAGEATPIPTHLRTHYGLQPFAQVLERGVWHSAHHARQLDVVSAGMGAEFQISDDLYVGLPLPKRLWA